MIDGLDVDGVNTSPTSRPRCFPGNTLAQRTDKQAVLRVPSTILVVRAPHLIQSPAGRFPNSQEAGTPRGLSARKGKPDSSLPPD